MQVINDVGAVHYGELTIIQPLAGQELVGESPSDCTNVIPCLPEAIHQ